MKERERHVKRETHTDTEKSIEVHDERKVEGE